MLEEQPFNLVGGHVALDFANTLDNRFDVARLQELIVTYDDFVRFAQQSRVLDSTEASRLNALAVSEKLTALRVARETREVLERIFSSVARRANVSAEDLEEFNNSLQKALRHRILIKEREAIRWAWNDMSFNALAPLWPIVLAAAELLTSAEIARVRECGAETCRWLFLDLSKNRTRRWCDMKLCGNRTKARRYYQTHS